MWALRDKKGSPDHEEDNFTFLGRGVEFKGVVTFDGTVRVDGRLDGEIHTTGLLIVGEFAVIKGIISAGVLMTSGKINGTVTADGRMKNCNSQCLNGRPLFQFGPLDQGWWPDGLYTAPTDAATSSGPWPFQKNDGSSIAAASRLTSCGP